MFVSWEAKARPSQLEPKGDWLIWLLQAGRGFGKTATGAGTTIKKARSGEWKHIALVAPTSADARDIMINEDDINNPRASGILPQSPPDFLAKYYPSKRRIEWPNGAVATIFSAEDPDQLRGPEFDGAWCLVGETKVNTLDGVKRLDSVTTADYVLTRKGYRRVLAVSSRMAQVGTVKLSNGEILTGTFNHKVATDKGWEYLGNLSCESLIGIQTTMVISLPKLMENKSGNIDMFGSKLMGQSQMAIKSTIKTAIKQIINSPTFNAFQNVNIMIFMLPNENLLQLSVLDAAQLSIERTKQDPFVNLVNISKRKNDEKSQLFAYNVGQYSIPVMRDIAVNVVSTWQIGKMSRVFDLLIEDEHEFIANGVVVHNCDELVAWPSGKREEAWSNLDFALRQGKSQRIVTTTPKPILLLKKIRDMEKTVITYGSTQENISNLSQAYIDTIIKPYLGTRLGKQEIEGLLIEDNPAALFDMDIIDANRVDNAPDLEIIAVSIDPSGSKDGNGVGIVVGGRDSDIGYLIDDRSLDNATPNQWAIQAINAYDDYKANYILIERNFGGDMAANTIKLVAQSLNRDPPPIKEVFASRGKVVRAEPISSLSQQGRIKHVGTFPLLEDELYSLESGQSDDRADAYVWLFTDLLGKPFHRIGELNYRPGQVLTTVGNIWSRKF